MNTTGLIKQKVNNCSNITIHMAGILIICLGNTGALLEVNVRNMAICRLRGRMKRILPSISKYAPAVAPSIPSSQQTECSFIQCPWSAFDRRMRVKEKARFLILREFCHYRMCVHANAVHCRQFFISKEDIYLPGYCLSLETIFPTKGRSSH